MWAMSEIVPEMVIIVIIHNTHPASTLESNIYLFTGSYRGGPHQSIMKECALIWATWKFDARDWKSNKHSVFIKNKYKK